MPAPLSSKRELQILRTIAEALNGAGSVDAALATTLEQVTLLLGLETGWIWLGDPVTGRYYGAVARELPPALREPVRMTGTPCWCLQAFKSGKLQSGNVDVMECSRLRTAVGDEGADATAGLRYHASIPLYFGTRPLGIMNLAAPAWRKLTARELDLLSTIASQLGVAIERARLSGEHVHTARVEERTRLARDLHDTLAQRLTAIGFHLESALADVPAASPAAVPMRRALTLTREGLDEARVSIRMLRDGRGVLDALEPLVHAFTGDTGVRVHLQAAALQDLSDVQGRELLQVVGEALMNVRKHAEATDVGIVATSDRRRIRLTVTDNGRGFNPRAPVAGYGLRGMRERVETLGGTFRLSSSPGTGTTIRLTIPRPGTAA